uniref:Polypeptide N-acetylgalactosaminyltransferase n=1 Tax=Sinocyclocheilus grahami TaxID=75366 RepID=A0A672SDB1_SINGR
MAICGRRSRPKFILYILGAFVVGYLVFHRNTHSDVGLASRREVPVEEPKNVDEELLKKPVYEKPPLDINALGEMGRAVKLDLTEEEKREEEESIKKHQINTYVSDRISLHHHLKEPLENYIANLKKVRLIRARKREGLVRARLLGASIATGEVLTFLDCHCECHEGWLEPLLQRIKDEPSAVVCPVIDVIDWNTFQYLGNPGEPQIGGFDWRLVFTWHTVPEHEQKRRSSATDVIRSPTMAGGLFAVNKKYFHYLGTYDTGMEVWGGENLEFSFRIWQCGGSLEIHPCSHVGHVFPKKAPYSRNKALANSVRAAEVWMDEYKEMYYHRSPHARLEAYGDVMDRRKLRMHLGCKDFKWFLENIYPDIQVPEDRPGMFGMLKNKGMANYCFDYNPPDDHNMAGHQVILYPCHGMGQNQFFEYSTLQEIRYNTREPAGCVVADPVSTFLTMHHCSKPREAVPEDQKFLFREDGSLYHVQTQKCIEAVARTDTGNPGPALRPCSDSASQKWLFEERTYISVP